MSLLLMWEVDVGCQNHNNVLMKCEFPTNPKSQRKLLNSYSLIIRSTLNEIQSKNME